MFILQLNSLIWIILIQLLYNFSDMKKVARMAGTPKENRVEMKIYIFDIVRLPYVGLFKVGEYNLNLISLIFVHIGALLVLFYYFP